MRKIKGVFQLIWFLIKTTGQELRKKRTWVIVGFILWTYLIAWFNANYYMQSPVKQWQRVIVPRYSVKPIKKAIISPKKVAVVEKKPDYTAEFELAYDTVLFRESNRGNDKTGLNGYCIKKGMVNQIGYAPHENYCFVDVKEQKETFMLWLSNRLNHKKMPYCNTVNECILFYSSNAYGI